MSFAQNATRRTELAAEGKVVRSAWGMALGAMFRGLRGQALCFVWWRDERIAITNLFVPEPIDILWLDRDLRVVDVREGFRPWRLHAAPKAPARYVLELPAGAARRARTRVGDVVTVQGLGRNLFKTKRGLLR